MDDLNTPLAAPPPTRRWLRLPVTLPQAIAALSALPLAILLAWTVVSDDPLGGEPTTIASLPQPNTEKSAARRPGPGAGAADSGNQAARARYDGPSGAAANAPAGNSVTIIDGSTGKRQQVAIPGSPKRKDAVGINDSLIERTRDGPLPRIAANGLRPVDAYASPAAKALANQTGPRIAIVVAGLGVSASNTADALSRLPAAVSLAFVPYGANLQALAAQARARGHEVLLEAPMEPFDYPNNDPGPQTLLTSISSEQNLDRLHWLMGRFQGYVGLMNYMGARFTASEKAISAVLDEANKRGLLYLDDGSSARSVARHVAAANSMPFVKADEVIDAVASPAEIDHALTRLESIAREHGIAVGTASALPLSIEHIASWAKAVQSHGIALIPITVAALKAKSS